ncbi:uncharacterized protein K452DRAFT_217748 [Aplosporella prunicola CBS 121167]|uniref:DNA polymerase epsilon subunit B n=1 Tax=Aplosporella prunicola CBS 121167 TaxID=1176127 RepID=A0A6A6BTX0_9PEZI|nr:uncharacterized protein K452DRAFT_217748 [Aplosporella prunicola CBS 121167]KAF2147562.1 hypothetical protein K452DRAFT_217748 [Aplosporella prunicola CBS 121167]
MASLNRPREPEPAAVLSSSPAFATPVAPTRPLRTAPIAAPAALKPTVLPVLLPPATLRPLAFRVFTKKHNLTLGSSALAALATFVGRHCGSGWREQGLAERVLEEVARAWKKGGGQVIVDAEGPLLKSILKTLEGCMSGGRVVQAKQPPALGRDASFKFGQPEKQDSFGMSELNVADDDDDDDDQDFKGSRDPRDWIKVVSAFEQPKMVYNVTKKHFDRSTARPSLFPPPSHKTDLFRQRYHIIHQRLLRNDAFQTPSFAGNRSSSLHRTASISTTSTNKITPVANLLGRSGSDHLLLGLLAVSPTGTLVLSDLSGSISLDLSHARPIPEDGAWFAPGMIVLVDGTYEEDYSNPQAGSAGALGATGGIGGTIGGKFIGFSVGHPPPERRSHTLGTPDAAASSTSDAGASMGPAFGWTDFLGLGSERATGARMRRIESRLLGPDAPAHKQTKIAIAADVCLDNPATFSALRALLGTYDALPPDEYPLAVVLMGNFVANAAMAGVPGQGSIEYKEHFNALAAVLGEFPRLVARTTLVFVPGDNDGWASAAAAGAAAPLPRLPVPDMFTSRVRRVVADANRDFGGSGGAAAVGGGPGRRREGEAIWTSNPARLTWFGVLGEMVLFRDDVTGRLRRTGIRNSREATVASVMPSSPPPPPPSMDMDTTTTTPAPPPAAQPAADPHTHTARALTRTLLDQSHLSPFALPTRPVHWDHAHALGLYPLPSAVVVADTGAPAFALRYAGVAVLNPGGLSVGRGGGGGGAGGKGGRARWVEYCVRGGGGAVREA